jgi:hypothetical protein
MRIKEHDAPPCFGPIAHLIARAETVCKPDDQKHKRVKKGRFKFTEQQKLEILKDRLSGMPIKETAHKWGCSVNYITSKLPLRRKDGSYRKYEL